MSLAAWLLPVLWREHDWRAALERLAHAGSRSTRTALELARALEYIEPDRRRAIASYELAGDRRRARQLAAELGWWSARARLALAARADDQSAELVLDEAEAWWDAGQPDLCALALAGVRDGERGDRGEDLAALLAERDLEDRAAEAVGRAIDTKGRDAADAYVMAARFSRAAGQLDNMTRWLEAAVTADPRHTVAASCLLELARRQREPDAIKRYLDLRLAGADLETWLGAMRSCALALVDSEHHRGFGQRLLRQTLERAYAEQVDEVPGHLAMWTLLAGHASAAGTRRELLPFVITALQSSQLPVDRVWLGALATEISLRDGGNAVVAGAYAEIVAEHAPEHPIVRELVATVAEAPGDAPSSPVDIPNAAIAAAKNVGDDAELDDAYAVAAEMIEADEVREVAAQPQRAEPIAAPVAAPPAVAAKSVERDTEQMPPLTRPPGPAALPKVAPKASIAPASLAQPATPARSASIVPASIANSSTIIPTLLKTAPIPRPARPISTSGLPPLSRAVPVLAALRTPDRPGVPPKPADPPNARLRARRITIPIDVRLTLPDGKRGDGTSKDVSTTGLFVLTTMALGVGIELVIDLLLPGKEAFTEDEFRVRARVVRKADDGYGLELLAPDAALVAALDALG